MTIAQPSPPACETFARATQWEAGGEGARRAGEGGGGGGGGGRGGGGGGGEGRSFFSVNAGCVPSHDLSPQDAVAVIPPSPGLRPPSPPASHETAWQSAFGGGGRGSVWG